MEKGKIIVLDFGIFMFRSIFSWRNNRQIPPEYTCLNMMLASLRRIGVEPYDTIIVAIDEGRSWRKEIETDYKANRKEFREKFEDINWKDMYSRFDTLKDKLNKGTDWHLVKGQNLEADDWMAVACRYYKDKEVILVTYDADMEQLAIYDNVKIFSPLVKYKSGRGAYKIIKNPYKILAKKIEKETADNLTNPILSEQDYEKRKMIVSLIELPEFVENRILEVYQNLKEKESYDISFIPYEKIRDKILNLYNDKEKLVTYEDCLKKKQRKRRKKK